LQAALVPRWAEVGGRRELRKRINDPQIRPRLLSEMEMNLKQRGGANSFQIADSPNREYVGKRLDAIAQQLNKTPVEAALELIKLGSSGAISFNMNEQDVRRFMKEKFTRSALREIWFALRPGPARSFGRASSKRITAPKRQYGASPLIR